MIREIFAKFLRKIKFGINIPKKVFKKPSGHDAVISDLFPILSDDNWSTEFEFLNLPGLIQGNISREHKALMMFFDKNGSQLGEIEIEINQVGRKTIILKEMLRNNLKNSATFAIFHKSASRETSLGQSFMAERGYVGYKNKNSNIKGYVHGNLDAIAFSNNKIQMLGNIGWFKKTYLVQHILTGPAIYDFIITNPTYKKKVVIIPRIKYSENTIKLNKLKIPSRGVEKISIEMQSHERAIIYFKSKLYLARPIVFRNSIGAFDVFHG